MQIGVEKEECEKVVGHLNNWVMHRMELEIERMRVVHKKVEYVKYMGVHDFALKILSRRAVQKMAGYVNLAYDKELEIVGMVTVH